MSSSLGCICACIIVSKSTLQNYQPDQSPDYQLRADSSSINCINIITVVLFTRIISLIVRIEAAAQQPAAAAQHLEAGRDADHLSAIRLRMSLA